MKRLFAKRYMKNTLVVLLIAAMCGCAFFTMKYAQSHVSSGADTMMSPSAGDGSQTADQHEDSSGDSQSAQSGEEQGAAPDSQSSGGSDRSSGSSDQQPPAKPDGDSGGAPAQQSSDAQTADNSGQSDTSVQSQDQQNDQNDQGGMPPDMNTSGSSSALPVGYYFVFGTEGIILAAGVMYLIMTRGGKKSIKELTMNRDKITIFILSVVLLASAFTFSCSGITGSAFISSAAETGQMGGPGGQSSGTASYSAVKEITSDETIKDETYSSENSDENAVLATGSITAQLSDTTITRTGDSDGGDYQQFVRRRHISHDKRF